MLKANVASNTHSLLHSDCRTILNESRDLEHERNINLFSLRSAFKIAFQCSGQEKKRQNSSDSINSLENDSEIVSGIPVNHCRAEEIVFQSVWSCF